MFSTNWRVRVNKMILLSSISPNETKWETWIHRLKISPSSQVLAFFRSMIISYDKNKLYSQPHPTLTQESEFVDWVWLSCVKPRFGSVSWSQRLVLPSVREQLESVVLQRFGAIFCPVFTVNGIFSPLNSSLNIFYCFDKNLTFFWDASATI